MTINCAIKILLILIDMDVVYLIDMDVVYRFIANMKVEIVYESRLSKTFGFG